MKIDINAKLNDKVLENFIEQVQSYKEHDIFNMIENRTFILDMLYCLGECLNPKEYRWADGFRNFQKDLIIFLAQHNHEIKEVSELFKFIENKFLEEEEMEI